MPSETMPRQNASVEIEEMENESLLYRRPAKTASYLNETATVIWKLCDGSRSTEDIVNILSKSYPEAADQIRADVTATIEQLIEAGALRMAKPREGETRSVVELEVEENSD